MTDIRPVFGDKDEPAGLLAIHNLKLTFFEPGGYSSVFIALDDADLAALKAAVERAEMKTKSIEKLVAPLSAPYFPSKKDPAK